MDLRFCVIFPCAVLFWSPERFSFVSILRKWCGSFLRSAQIRRWSLCGGLNELMNCGRRVSCIWGFEQRVFMWIWRIAMMRMRGNSGTKIRLSSIFFHFQQCFCFYYSFSVVFSQLLLLLCFCVCVFVKASESLFLESGSTCCNGRLWHVPWSSSAFFISSSQL